MNGMHFNLHLSILTDLYIVFSIRFVIYIHYKMNTLQSLHLFITSSPPPLPSISLSLSLFITFPCADSLLTFCQMLRTASTELFAVALTIIQNNICTVLSLISDINNPRSKNSKSIILITSNARAHAPQHILRRFDRNSAVFN